jgi:hypothetical protein
MQKQNNIKKPPHCITICMLPNHQNKNLAIKNDKNQELDLIKGKDIVST